MNAQTRFFLKLIGSLILACLAAVCISYNWASFGLVFLVSAYAFCPIRSLKPHARSPRNGKQVP